MEPRSHCAADSISIPIVDRRNGKKQMNCGTFAVFFSDVWRRCRVDQVATRWRDFEQQSNAGPPAAWATRLPRYRTGDQAVRPVQRAPGVAEPAFSVRPVIRLAHRTVTGNGGLNARSLESRVKAATLAAGCPQARRLSERGS
jgi:hypothetical protein